MNGYYQLDIRSDGAFLIVHKPSDNGEPVKLNEVCEYLSRIGVKTIDKDSIRSIIESDWEEAEGRVSVIFHEEQPAILMFELDEEKMTGTAKLIPPSKKGPKISAEDLIDQLGRQRIRYGVIEEAIKEAVSKELYNTEFVFAKGTPAEQGTDARIEYYFQTEKNFAPKLNDDGTVDYHELNNISHIQEGQLLARLYPEDLGKNGMNILGELLRPRKVKRAKLSYGNNIEINEDKTEIYSMVTGHADLINGKVFVSNIYLVPADVDNTTGNIDFEGTVEIKGNVRSGFTVKAGGDIIIGGVVEAAKLEAKGQIIITNGVHGMGRCSIYAGGSVTAKFIENASVFSDESVNADSILHSNVHALYDVRVKGKKGFIAGGNIQAGHEVETQTLGSPMGVLTVVEVGCDPRSRTRAVELERLIAKTKSDINRIEPTINAAGKQIGVGIKFPPEKMAVLQQLSKQYTELKKNLKEYEEEYAGFDFDTEASGRASVNVRGDVYSGVTVVISDVSKTMSDKRSSCKFVRQDGDIHII